MPGRSRCRASRTRHQAASGRIRCQPQYPTNLDEYHHVEHAAHSLKSSLDMRHTFRAPLDPQCCPSIEPRESC